MPFSDRHTSRLWIESQILKPWSWNDFKLVYDLDPILDVDFQFVKL